MSFISTRNLKYFTNVFYFYKMEKTKVILFRALYLCFYLEELEYIPQIVKNFNDLYYFQKVKHRETN